MKTIDGLHKSELAKITEVKELPMEEIKKIQKQFTSLYKADDKTVIVKDWIDDSVQIIKVK